MNGLLYIHLNLIECISLFQKDALSESFKLIFHSKHSDPFPISICFKRTLVSKNFISDEPTYIVSIFKFWIYKKTAALPYTAYKILSNAIYLTNNLFTSLFYFSISFTIKEKTAIFAPVFFLSCGGIWRHSSLYNAMALYSSIRLTVKIIRP